ncbi:GTP binding protein-like protein [Dothidotthia symphoricarpi CBS 119687]|uniref:GTP binding protein-like protein n=1 Tax=Dothidotthia symphoricarpi CBS 119687 TaxID=1392245 RepID=A0A6A6AQU4_9PLEO|nr:GTP binding protein-like protein [Dothidotthia symphoricarpi CBS 119687]KAF2133375.1 GTP binding protein-like protein [Dothidotthia symphoricarpi CBS 119687]
MASFPSDSPEFIDSVELLLEHGPDDENTALGDLLQQLEKLEEDENFGVLEKVAQALGTAVGKQKTWQTPFRELGILESVLKRLDQHNAPLSLQKQYLRVVGNCVADNDASREIVIRHMLTLVEFLTQAKLEELVPIALVVLFNLCNDFDPAKAGAAALRLDVHISGLLVAGKVPEGALDYATDLLNWTTEKLTAVQMKDGSSLKVFASVLKVTLQYDEDHYHEYVAILVHYLQDQEFQQLIATPELLDGLVVLMLDFEARLTSEEIAAVFQELAISKKEEKISSDETNVLLLSQLIASISAISATDAFAQDFNVRSPVVEQIRARLRTQANSPSTVCTCVILGNLAMSDEVCIDMVNIMQLHVTLGDILSSSKESALLFAAAGFMRHLTFPEANREILGDAGLLQVCNRLLLNTDPAVRGEAAAMLCKLVTNNFHNIMKVVYEKGGEIVTVDTPQVAGIGTSTEPTILDCIATQALAPSAPLPSTAMKNSMIELGRTIVTMLRYLGRAGAEEDVDAVRRQMFKVPLIARPVARLVRQRFYADARSEGLLGLGLMAQSAEGAARVIEEFKEDDGLLDAIKDFANGKDGGIEQQESTGGRDYQNAIVLLQALQNNWGDETDNTLRNDVATLQNELGKLMT